MTFDNRIDRAEISALELEMLLKEMTSMAEQIQHLRYVLGNIAYSGKTKSGMKEDALRALGLKK